MKKIEIHLVFILFLLLIFPVEKNQAGVQSEKQLKNLSVEVVQDKIRGGLLGQILGNLNGLPHENKYLDEPGNVKNYVPALPEGARTDDDTDFEWVYICEMQKNRNVYLSPEHVTRLWKERINKKIWCSNRFARHLMDIGIEPPYTGYPVFNPWAGFNISGQFLCETFGLIAPCMPQTAAKIGLNYTTVTISNEPAQTTQLFTTMIATAFDENDLGNILDAGVASLDKSSTIFQVVNDVRKWYYENAEDWKKTRRLLKEKYTQEGGSMRDWNGHELNTGSIIAALLYGNGDFAESLKTAFNYGWDADCNAATVGTIVGVIYGYRKMMNHNDPFKPDWQIVDRYKNTTRENMPMDETITSFADRLVELFEMVNENNGGSKKLLNNSLVYQIPEEQPEPVTWLASVEEQKKKVKDKFENQINEELVNGNREDRARAAYMAVCLDIDKELAQKYPKQWQMACNDLSGYWKIMNNIFFGDFTDLNEFRKKFELAGFNAPAKQFGDNALYNDLTVWKDPAELFKENN